MIRDSAKRQQAQPTIDKLIDATQQVCMDDLWSDAAKSCLGGAKRMDDLERCEDTLSKQQQDNAEERLEALMEQLEEQLRD
jgi:hypothetical protein